MPDELSPEERLLLLRLLTRAINYKSNSDTLRIAQPLLAKMRAAGRVVLIERGPDEA